MGADLSPYPGDSVQLISFNSDMSINVKTMSEIIGYYHSGASGDVDNDGDGDILTANYGTIGSVSVINGAFPK